jgi:YebC/PmpR family DNA-binding regulatory protein
MSGHSKWASIKHKKAIVDARRGQHFTKLARAITVAARDGGGDPEMNAALGNAVQKARDASMPKDNIERAIAKGIGAGADAEAFAAVNYEGYGPGGVALLIETLTDNRNRTAADLRHLLGKAGGNLGEPGSVAYLFNKRGVIVVDGSGHHPSGWQGSEDDLLVAIEAGAEDIVKDGDTFEIVCDPSDLAAVRGALEEAGIELESAEVTQQPTTRIEIDEEVATRLLRLIDALDENDDVGAVHANFEVSDEILERVAG